MNSFLQRVHHWDTLVFLWMHVTKGFQFPKSVKFISYIGNGPLYFLIAITLLFLDSHNGRAFFIVALVAFTFDIFIYLSLKKLIKRKRPPVAIEAYQHWNLPSNTFSFPSGQTAAAFLMACLTANFYPALTGAFFVWALLVGASRILIGAHYPSDVLAGAALGGSCAFASIYFYSTQVGL